MSDFSDPFVLHIYRIQMNLWEGNVLSCACPSVSHYIQTEEEGSHCTGPNSLTANTSNKGTYPLLSFPCGTLTSPGEMRTRNYHLSVADEFTSMK